jgi:hypothetical protein
LAKIVRGMMSAALPGLKGTIARIGLVGQSSADDCVQKPIDISAIAQSHRHNIIASL